MVSHSGGNGESVRWSDQSLVKWWVSLG